MNRAIARTIELTCTVKHGGIRPGDTQLAEASGPPLYRTFWKSLLKWRNAGNELPTIITFNYDLVLERALFQTLIGTETENRNEMVPEKHIRIEYHYDHVPKTVFELCNTNFHSNVAPYHKPGTTLKYTDLVGSDSLLDIEILKLHGSVNFPQNKVDHKSYGLVQALNTPRILPPIFNKLSGAAANSMWEVAIQRLRVARNIVVVGYSLPRTDIYMQYFLKTALGPNLNFNRMTIYDPALHSIYDINGEMRARYEACFSPQLKSRINFEPEPQGVKGKSADYRGTTRDFIETLRMRPDTFLF